ncbi:uncharacterized protein ALTATR162_LOCUS1802 [Alternaria atra]|uniref:Uncharacterized protein n=1 Tax=Alternaria atra TaxID=119953 RepID=A0A8J2HY80_9PLEO|nr:uncharacterized protein ALTATR162_LOCUS1802 [Alternaria atra]CAG5145973.1 unnamed protein product [Alternaria atra]
MSSAHDTIMSFVTVSAPDSLEEYTTEHASSGEENVAATSEAKRASRSASTEKNKIQETPKRNRRSTKSTQTSPTTDKTTAVSSGSSTFISAAGSNEAVSTRSASSTKKTGRTDRNAKKFVVLSKDPRAIAKTESPRGNKRAAENKKGGRAKRQVRSSQELGLIYNSIKAINMPPRVGQVPGQVPPTPVVGDYPFGDTEDHQNSMIIYWLDDLENTYAKTTILYNETFPNDKVTDEAVRRRHIRSLERLQKRYGAKPVAQIGIVGRNIARRGRPRAPRLSGIEPENDPADAAAPYEEQVEGDASVTEDNSTHTSHSPPRGSLAKAIDQVQREKRNHKGHEFDKACIVVWRDADKMSFKDIRAKLDNERGWSLGEPTVKKEYTRARARIWGTTSLEVAADEDDESKRKAAEDEQGEDMEMEDDLVEQKEI